MASWKNKSKDFRVGHVGLPYGSLYIGNKKPGTWQGMTLVKFRQDYDVAELEGVTIFGEDAKILKEEYDNDRFFFECLNPLLLPTKLSLEVHLDSTANFMRLDSKSGGDAEGTYHGNAGWKQYSQGGEIHTGIVICTNESEYHKSGKSAWVTWIYPSPGLYAAETFIHWGIRYEIAPPAPTFLQKIYLAVKPKPKIEEVPFPLPISMPLEDFYRHG